MSDREPDELTGLEKLIPDVPGSQGRAIRGYEIFFHAASKRLFVHTYQGKQEIYWSGEAYLPYVLGCLGKLIGSLLKQQEIDEKHRRSEVDRINEAVADKLVSLQQQNEAMILLLSQRSGAEEGTKEELQAQVEALKAARAADKAGFEAVIRVLREEVARLTGGVDCKDEVLRLADDYAKTAWLDGRDGNKTSPMQDLMRKSLNDILQGIGQHRGVWAKNQDGAK